MLKRCTCDNKYQDKTYGEKVRVHNVYKAKGGQPKARCTVCNSEKDA